MLLPTDRLSFSHHYASRKQVSKSEVICRGVPNTMGLSWYSPGLAREIFLIWKGDTISDPYPPDSCWKKWGSLKLYVSWGSCRLSVSNRCFFQLTGFHFHTIIRLESKCRSLKWFVGRVPSTMGLSWYSPGLAREIFPTSAWWEQFSATVIFSNPHIRRCSLFGFCFYLKPC